MWGLLLSALLLAAPAVPTGTWHGCGLTGTARPRPIQALNVLKNRSVAPDRIDAAITAAALMQPGADLDRWSPDAGATIRLYVTNVKVGGIESVNCGARAAIDRDTHIEGNATGPGYRGQPLIVEVTPRWRAAMQATGVDWSTPALRRALRGNWVEVSGWLFVDVEHAQNAVNTNPRGTTLWRQTVVELHPVTALRVLP